MPIAARPDRRGTSRRFQTCYTGSPGPGRCARRDPSTSTCCRPATRVAPEESPRYAFLGVRGCDLAAISTLDRVLGGGAYPDTSFARRRRHIFVVAVNCTEPGGLCFCASMGTGPAAGPGYDLGLTERIDGDECRYLVDVGSDDGAAVLSAVLHREATTAEIDSAR